MQHKYSTESIVHYLQTSHPMAGTPSHNDFPSLESLINSLLDEPLDYRIYICLKVDVHSYYKRSPITRLLHDFPEDHGLDKRSIVKLLEPTIKNLYIEGLKITVGSYARQDESLAIKLLKGIPLGEEAYVLGAGFQFSRNYALTPTLIDAFEQKLRKAVIKEDDDDDMKGLEALIDILIDNKDALGSATMDILLQKIGEDEARECFIKAALNHSLTRDLGNSTRKERKDKWYLHSFFKVYGKDWITNNLIQIVNKHKYFDPSEIMMGSEFFDGEAFFKQFLEYSERKGNKGLTQSTVLKHYHKAEDYPSLMSYLLKDDNLNALINNAPSAGDVDSMVRIGVAHAKHKIINILKQDAADFPSKNWIKDFDTQDNTKEQAEIAYLIKKPAYKHKTMLRELGLEETSNLLGKINAQTYTSLRAIFDDVDVMEFADIVQDSSQHILRDQLGL